MSAIIEAASISGLTFYSVIRNSSASVWNGSTFEAYASGHWSTYAVALTEQTSSGYYSAAFPSAIAAGKYSRVLHRQLGGTPALGDPVFGADFIYWNGSVEEQGFGSVLTTLTLAEQTVGAPPSTPALSQALMYLFMAWRNQVATTATSTKVTNNAGTVLTTATLSDDGTTFTKGQFA